MDPILTKATVAEKEVSLEELTADEEGMSAKPAKKRPLPKEIAAKVDKQEQLNPLMQIGVYVNEVFKVRP